MEFRPPRPQRGAHPRTRGNPHFQQQQQQNPPPRMMGNNNMGSNIAWQNSYPAQEDGMAPYQQPTMDSYTTNFSQFPHNITSPEMNTQSQYNHPYPVNTQCFLTTGHTQMYTPVDTVFMNTQQISLPTTATPPVINTNSVPTKKVVYGRESIFTCINCNHRNSLAESECIKKDEEYEDLRKKYHLLEAELQRLKEESMQETGHINLVQSTKQSQLSPDAQEFSPKNPEITASTVSREPSEEVPVVSANVMNEELIGDGLADLTEDNSIDEQLTSVCDPINEEVVHNVPEQMNKIHSTVMKEETPDHWDDNSTLEPVGETFTTTKMEDQLDSQQKDETACQEVKKEKELSSRGSSLVQPTDKSSSKPDDDFFQESRPNKSNRNKRRHLEQGSMNHHPGIGRGKGSQKSDQVSRFQQNQPSNRNTNDKDYQKKPYNKQNQQGYGDEKRDGKSEYQNKEDGSIKDQVSRDGTSSKEFKEENWETKGDKYRSREDRNNQRDQQHNRDGLRDDSQASQNSYNRGRNERTHEDHRRDSNYHSKDERWDSNRNKPREDRTTSHRDEYNRRSDDRRGGDRYDNSQSNGSGWSSNPYRSKNIIEEFKADLFAAPSDFSLGHCVAKDFRMGSGIAVKFRTEFKRVGELMDQNVDVGGCAFLEDKENNRYIFYLVTKHVSNGKPTYESLKNSLIDMKGKCQKFGVKKLALPRIGCGLDRLDWGRVKNTINEVFEDAEIKIDVYDFNVEGLSEAEGNKPTNTGVMVKYQIMNLINIEGQTALLFLGTEDGHMDTTASCLNTKFKFANDYKKAQTTMGNVWAYTKHQEYFIYSLIVCKTIKDKVLFCTVEQCCKELVKCLRRDKFEYVGLEVAENWSNDETFTEKIVTMLRYMLPKPVYQLWVCYTDPKLDVYEMCRKSFAK